MTLSPIFSFSNNLKIEHLVKDGVIDKEFASDVLMVDFQNPMFSKNNTKKTSGNPVFLKNNSKKTWGNPIFSKHNLKKTLGHPMF